VDVIYDGVGATTFEKGLTCIRPRGVMALYGAASGPVGPLDLQLLNANGSLFVTRPSLNTTIASREELVQRSGDVLGWIRDGKLKLRVETTFPLDKPGKRTVPSRAARPREGAPDPVSARPLSLRT
jgi:NADPH2:quinone reductase